MPVNILMEQEMRVRKRCGELATVEFDKILRRLKTLGNTDIKINYTALTMKVIDQLFDGISTTKIDELSAEQCASMASLHHDYNTLAGRIVVSNHHKNTEPSFAKVMSDLYNFKDKHGLYSPLVSEQLYQVVQSVGQELDQWCDFSMDYLIDYFGFKTLERSYLMKINGKTVERPQHMWLRVAIGIHGTDMALIKETYEYMSRKYFTHATPTLFNAGTPHPQLSSCFLQAMESDSIEGIYNTLKDCALISKWAGGIGLHIHNVRASGSHIRGTNGQSNGIVPMLKVFNNTAKYVDQCVEPETIIYTTDGPKQIQSCVENNTQIYGLQGQPETIQKILEHPYEGPVLQIYSSGSDKPLKITPEHPVYILRQDQCDWIDAKDILVGDKLVHPIPTVGEDDDRLTCDDCYMYGFMAKHAYLSTFERECSVPISDANRVLLNDYFNKFCVQTTETNGRLKWLWSAHLPFRYTDFFDTNYNRRLNNRWFNLPITKASFILQGLLFQDATGHSFCPRTDDDTTIRLDTKNSASAEQIKFLCLRMGLYCTITEKSVLHIPKTHTICNILGIHTTNPVVQDRIQNNLLTTITDIQTTEYSGILYDLQMKLEHNYLLTSGLVHNGGGRRNGSFAIYMEPWHADIELFLQMRKNHGDEELKARDLFYAMWIPDLFMERVKANGTWTLMCPDECPNLSDVYGDEFVQLYTKYETEGKGRRTINARDVWYQILDAQMETGTPYILFKDACNKKSNQKNLGTIKSSNLCVAPETMVLTDRGHREIQTMCGEKVNVWNGEQFSEVEIVKTGTGQDLISIYTDDGSKLDCTPYHKFYIYNNNEVHMVEAKDLKPYDKLIQCEYPVIDGTDIYSGSSTPLHIENTQSAASLSNEQMCNTFGPTHTCSLTAKLQWFAGYCDAVGQMSDNGDLNIVSSEHEFLLRIRLLLQTCGVSPKVIVCTGNNDGTLYRLLVSSYDVCALYANGFRPRQLQILEHCGTKPFITIIKVENNNRCDDTYCFVEPKRHMGVFNGILTGQCTEIIQYSDEKETAVCNLASISLPAFVSNGKIDYEELHKVSKIVINNLNRVIDVNYYPIEKTRVSNLRNRPTGLGTQGLSDCFMQLNLAFHSDEAKQINKWIFETMYHAALEKSCELAEQYGPYETFHGSPASQGILQFDMWNVDPTNERYDWTALKERIKTHGLRNSLLLAPMPTASTSQILGNNECIEPITSNIYSRKTMAGEFIMVNKYMMNDLLALDLWNEKMKNNIIANNGSIQHIDAIPKEIRDKYRTVWEVPMKHLIDMSADRGAFICQSQSLNLWLEDPNYNTLTSMHFYSWSKGLKTGIYYLRRRARHQAQQFTIEPTQAECLMCGA